MKTKESSPQRISRLRTQGYVAPSDQQLAEFAFGHRFAFKLCFALLAMAVASANIPFLAIIMCFEFLGIVSPRHPFDHIYNGIIRKWTAGVELPSRAPQLRFACKLALICTGITVLLFLNEQMIAGYLLGSSLVLVAGLVGFLDLCIPSIIYKALFLSYKRAEPLELTLKPKLT